MRITALISTLALSAVMSTVAAATPGMAGNPDIAVAPAPIIHQGSFNVSLNKTELVHLPEAAAAIVVGNPNIADVSVHSSDTIFIVGRGYGETNIIVLNGTGQTVLNATVHVVGAMTHKNVRVYNGGAQMRSTYNCAPYCQPSPILGDDAEFISANTPQSTPISNSFASGSAVSSTQNVGSAYEHGEGLEAAQEPNINNPAEN